MNPFQPWIDHSIKVGTVIGEIEAYLTVVRHLIANGMDAYEAAEYINIPVDKRSEVISAMDDPDFAE